MACEAAAANLAIDDEELKIVLGDKAPGDPKQRRFAPEDARATMHRSLKGAWVIAEFIPKRHRNSETGRKGWRINLFRRRRLPDAYNVHEVVDQIGDDYASRVTGTANRVS